MAFRTSNLAIELVAVIGLTVMAYIRDIIQGVRNMPRISRAPYFMLALALLGIAVAFYDAQALYGGEALWCPPPIDGCNEVANSPYARIFNLPVGYFGVVYYLYMFGLAALLAFDPLSRGLRFAALAYAALGVSFSIYFLYLQIGFIHAFCIYCLISAASTLLLLVAALSHVRVEPAYVAPLTVMRAVQP